MHGVASMQTAEKVAHAVKARQTRVVVVRERAPGEVEQPSRGRIASDDEIRRVRHESVIVHNIAALRAKPSSGIAKPSKPGHPLPSAKSRDLYKRSPARFRAGGISDHSFL